MWSKAGNLPRRVEVVVAEGVVVEAEVVVVEAEGVVVGAAEEPEWGDFGKKVLGSAVVVFVLVGRSVAAGV